MAVGKYVSATVKAADGRTKHIVFLLQIAPAVNLSSIYLIFIIQLYNLINSIVVFHLFRG